MNYVVRGLEASRFAPLFALPDGDLARRGMRRITADADRGYPCRVSLRDASKGETLLLLNHASNETDGPYRSIFAIFVRECATAAARHVDTLPAVFRGRPISFRAYDVAGDLVTARLSPDDTGHDTAIRDLLSDPRVDHVDAHNAAHGCFSARIDRYRGRA